MNPRRLLHQGLFAIPWVVRMRFYIVLGVIAAYMNTASTRTMYESDIYPFWNHMLCQIFPVWAGFEVHPQWRDGMGGYCDFAIWFTSYAFPIPFIIVAGEMKREARTGRLNLRLHAVAQAKRYALAAHDHMCRPPNLAVFILAGVALDFRTGRVGRDRSMSLGPWHRLTPGTYNSAMWALQQFSEEVWQAVMNI